MKAICKHCGDPNAKLLAMTWTPQTQTQSPNWFCNYKCSDAYQEEKQSQSNNAPAGN